MKFLLALPLLILPLPSSATELQYRDTYCNGYYNSAVKRWQDVKCKAWFSNNRLVGLNFKLTPNSKTYNWWVGQKQVQPDKQWNECLRYTSFEGNQWQFCTVKNTQQLNIQ